MKKTICAISALSLILTLVFYLVFIRTGHGTALTCGITFGTIAYHFWMRLIVGFAFDRIMDNKADLSGRWYQSHTWERKLYRKLNVKQWKKKAPSYDADLFDLGKHSPEAVAQAMCQAELVHETIAVLSLVPILFSLRFGAPAVFIITSLIGMILDLAFAVIQRYNRPRIMKLIRRQPRQ